MLAEDVLDLRVRLIVGRPLLSPSLLVAMEVHPRVAMQILRHSRIALTMNVYSEVPTEDTREALRRLGERLSGEAS